jgi:CxxC motif-containing protein
MEREKAKQVELTCIGCPVGCALTVTVTSDGSVEVTGNKCQKGAAYGEKEVTNPTRIVTSTVPVEGRENTVVSVKTATDIPKDKIYACMEALKGVKVKAPVQIGDVVVSNVADTGVDIVATRGIK